ncbi:MAG: dTMP kinase [Halolamina sp.]
MLITLEGLDGSGKTTVWEALHDSHPEATFTHEPTESWYGEAVNRAIDGDADPLATLFLFTADHAAHLARTVRPALEDGSLVISDRYSDSRYAYQAAALEDSQLARPLEYIRGIHQAFTRPPDATVYIDVDPGTAVGRSGATNQFEQEAFLSKVDANYERLIDAEPDRFVRVDGTQSPEAVIDSVEDVIDTLVDAYEN